MKESKKKKDARKLAKSPEKLTKATKKGRIELGEEDLSRASGGSHKIEMDFNYKEY